MPAVTNRFAVLNDDSLVRAIAACQHCLVYVAPGISEPVAAAIDALLTRQQAPVVTVIIDTDPEVCRLGYGTQAGLTRLQAVAEARHLPLRYQPGLRIGVLIVDAQLWVYAPTPLLIEAADTHNDHPNGVLFTEAMALAAVAQACAADGAGENTPLPDTAEIGRQAATPQVLAASLDDLWRQPPKPYDLARIERVYNSRLQYVELEVTGYRLASRRVRIPNDLLIGNDKTLEQRMYNSFALLEGQESLVAKISDCDPVSSEPRQDSSGHPVLISYSEKQIEAERKALIKDFLTAIPGHGQLISKARRAAFDARFHWFSQRLEAFRKAVEEKLYATIQNSVEELTDALLPTVKRAPPERLLKHVLSQPPTDEDIRAALRTELNTAFQIGTPFYQPKATVVFKDLTYETIQNEVFRHQVEAAFRGITATDLFSEYDAAPERLRQGR